MLIKEIFRHNASEHIIKKNISTQTLQTSIKEHHEIIKSNFPEINKTYEKLKKCLYPDLFDCQNDKNGNKENFNS